MVASAMLGLIVLALMTVFNGAQTAFRAGITQTGVLESGRAVSDLIKSDLETMTPSFGYGTTNGTPNTNGAVNFCVANNYQINGYTPLFQSLVGVNNPNTRRTNVFESFFILHHENTKWSAVGYAVVGTNLQSDLYPLYCTNFPTTTDPLKLYWGFTNFLLYPTNGSHLMDGVVHLRVYAYNNSGQLMNTLNYFDETNVVFQQLDRSLVPDEVGCTFYSNKVPASVEVELGVLEDRTLQRAESLPNMAPIYAQTAYLSKHVGQVHIFRQRAWIRNVDPSAYQ
jgi:hypothetical protein